MIVLLVDGIQAIKAVGSTTAPTAEPRWTVMTMRLIDADALFAKAELLNKRERRAVQGALLVSPTIEAEPVRHGEWFSRYARHWKGRDECSECGYHEKDHRDLSHMKYCPNCGAKMDGDSHA